MILRRQITQFVIDGAARIVADQLRRHAEGPYNAPQTWQNVASRLNIRTGLYYSPGSGRGEFCPHAIPGPPTSTGVVTINTAYSIEKQCRAWVHELAHAVIWLWLPAIMDGGRDGWRYEGHPDDIQHRIARRVEGLIFLDKPVSK